MKNPLKEKALRLPGQSLDDKFNEMIYDYFFQYLIIILFLAMFIIFEWLHFYFPTIFDPLQFTVIGLSFIIFFVYRILKKIPEIKKIKQGRDGERVVGQQLEQLRSAGCLIYHDVIGQDFNIDHVIISPQGIFTIETKTWSKRNSKEEVKFDGNNFIINGYPSKDVYIQSIAEASWLKKIIKESTGKEFRVQPVTVFPGWFVDPESSKLAMTKGLWLLNPKALPEYIKNSLIIINNEDLNLIAFHLTRFIQNTL